MRARVHNPHRDSAAPSWAGAPTARAFPRRQASARELPAGGLFEAYLQRREAVRRIESARATQVRTPTLQGYFVKKPSDVDLGTEFKTQSIKKDRYSRAYEEGTTTAEEILVGERGTIGSAMIGFKTTSRETQTGATKSYFGGLPSVKISTNRRMAIHHTDKQPKEFFAESDLVDESNGKLAGTGSRIRLKKGSKSIKVPDNDTPLVRVTAAVPVPVDAEHTDGLREVTSYTHHKCDEFITQIVPFAARAISLLPDRGRAIDIRTGGMGEPLEDLLDYAVKHKDHPTSLGMKEHAEALPRSEYAADAYTSAARYRALDPADKRRVASSVGLDEHATADVGGGYVIASRFSAELMGGFGQTLNAEEYLAAIKKLRDLDPKLDATEQDVDDMAVLGMMKLWGSHYAGVVAKDGPDTVTYENYNRDTEKDWEIRDVFNNLFMDFEEFRRFVAETTDKLNLNADVTQAKELISEAHKALRGVITRANSEEERLKLALAKAQRTIDRSLESDAEHLQSLVYFQMYGAAEQSFHAHYKGMGSSPVTMALHRTIDAEQTRFTRALDDEIAVYDRIDARVISDRSARTYLVETLNSVVRLLVGYKNQILGVQQYHQFPATTAAINTSRGPDYNTHVLARVLHLTTTVRPTLRLEEAQALDQITIRINRFPAARL